ncbi:hypothetical protein J0X19_00530 [Hymenobacter sp. BT186]|uniref:DUF3575 domain-containing protein n=1 Tax=Hymenobacter telluris TaxID=2816474 RepID=A0A939ESE2_9BACT|nr:hypothetical protein [Hymenobacter telluris]MBO0356417.1 hypothetical protein [Hymenobacter telluris]MBW3372441.1 hypothetical protein [Hymenobacter norwichensis]
MPATRAGHHCQWLLLPALLLGIAGGAQGQSAPPTRTLLLKAVPQYVVVSGYWLEAEQSWKQHPNQSFAVTAQAYAGPAGNPNGNILIDNPFSPDQNRQVRGAGLQVHHRLYLDPAFSTDYPSGWYVSYGPQFQHFALSYDGLGWEEVEGPNGAPVYELRNGRHTETINRYGGSVQLGYQAPLPPGPVFLDLYVGFGWRESQSRGDSWKTSSRYSSGSSNYGHEGFYFPAGIKIGVALR